MTHPLTPREKVEPFERYPALASWIAKMASVGSGLSLGEWMTFVGALNAAIVQAEQRTALASGSGDHAELARLVEWRDRLRADPGRAAHFGSPYADKPMQNGRTYWNSDLADDITALIAEVAALRDQLDWMTRDRNAVIGERDRADTMMQSADARATEAERKLAEAVGLLRDLASWFDGSAYNGAWVIRSGDLGVDDAIFAARTFLSKEAERG